MSLVLLKNACNQEQIPPLAPPFEKLDDQIEDILHAMEITKPTEIEALTLPLALSHSSVLGIAKTGTGKTLAYLLPVLEDLLLTPHTFRALILSPTRELALQIASVLSNFKPLGLRVALLIGGQDFSSQELEIANRPHILIGCPGRVLDHFANTVGIKFSSLKTLILDECDKMLDLDFESDIIAISKKLPKTRQNLLFSATYSGKIQNLTKICNDECKIVKCEQDDVKTADNLVENICPCQLEDKIHYIAHIIRRTALKTIIFATRICDVEKVYYTLKNLQFSVAFLHGQMKQADRNQQLAQFKDAGAQILVSTEVAARGLDIDDIQLVLNYDVPLKAEDYVHRVGRTSRAGKGGLAVTVVCKAEIAALQAIEKMIGLKMSVFRVERDEIEAQRMHVGTAMREGEIELKRASKGGEEQ